MFVFISRLLVDFGLVILIWIIQLIVYPSFLYYSKQNLVIWHTKYTTLIGSIVGPLMLIQLMLAIYQVSTGFTIFTTVSLLMVSIVWLLTFFQFVPIHNAISRNNITEKMLLSLVHKNWLRTILWTLIFLCSVLDTVLIGL